MASNEFTLETAKQCLEDDGFLELQDSETGTHIEAFESAGSPFGTASALELLMEPLVCDPRIADILKSFPNKFVLRHSLKYIANPGRIFRHWPGGPDTSLLFAVHQWTKGSRAVYWVGSHKVSSPSSSRLGGEHGPLDPLNSGSEELLRKAGCIPREFCLPEGGIIFSDARVFCEKKEGYEIANVFFPQTLVHKFPMPRMPLLKSRIVEQKAIDIQIKSGIQIDFDIKWEMGEVMGEDSS